MTKGVTLFPEAESADSLPKIYATTIIYPMAIPKRIDKFVFFIIKPYKKNGRAVPFETLRD